MNGAFPLGATWGAGEDRRRACLFGQRSAKRQRVLLWRPKSPDQFEVVQECLQVGKDFLIIATQDAPEGARDGTRTTNFRNAMLCKHLCWNPPSALELADRGSGRASDLLIGDGPPSGSGRIRRPCRLPGGQAIERRVAGLRRVIRQGQASIPANAGGACRGSLQSLPGKAGRAESVFCSEDWEEGGRERDDGPAR